MMHITSKDVFGFWNLRLINYVIRVQLRSIVLPNLPHVCKCLPTNRNPHSLWPFPCNFGRAKRVSGLYSLTVSWIFSFSIQWKWGVTQLPNTQIDKVAIYFKTCVWRPINCPQKVILLCTQQWKVRKHWGVGFHIPWAKNNPKVLFLSSNSTTNHL